MRHEGRLTQWNDERGFGFIEPAQGGEPVFVHISALSRADRDRAARPQIGDRLSFEIEPDAQGRKQARRVVRVNAVARSAKAEPSVARRDRHRGQTQRVKTGFAGRLVVMLLTLAILVALGWKGYQRWAASGPEWTRAAVPMPVPSAVRSPAPAFQCDGRQYCSQMTSCAEATFFLRHCPGVKMDGNHDGVPCEQQWCTRSFAQ